MVEQKTLKEFLTASFDELAKHEITDRLSVLKVLQRQVELITILVNAWNLWTRSIPIMSEISEEDLAKIIEDFGILLELIEGPSVFVGAIVQEMGEALLPNQTKGWMV